MTQPGEAFADSIYSELEEVKGLIARGLQVGVLTYAEIVAATAELGLDDSDVEEPDRGHCGLRAAAGAGLLGDQVRSASSNNAAGSTESAALRISMPAKRP